MSANITLPDVEKWPYTEIAQAHLEFVRLFGTTPKVLWIGKQLWKNLQSVSPESTSFLVYDTIPVYCDKFGILGSFEFIFGG